MTTCLQELPPAPGKMSAGLQGFRRPPALGHGLCLSRPLPGTLSMSLRILLSLPVA